MQPDHETQAWSLEETRNIDLTDQRLNRRLCDILDQFAARPNAGIPEACGGHAELTAAYRLFDNSNVTFERILKPHIEATQRRMACEPTVLLVQDTTELDLTRPASTVKGTGPLDGSAREGMFLHLLHAFTPNGTPLGTVDAHMWTREKEQEKKTKLTRAQRAAILFEEKESYRWLQMLRRTQQAAERVPGPRYVCIGDSESDIYELLVEPVENIDWIIRGCQNRSVHSSTLHLLESALVEPVRYTQEISVRGRKQKLSCETRGRRQSRVSRKAQVEVRALSLTLNPPYRKEGPLPPANIQVVLVKEVDTPEGEEPIEWMLLTSLRVDTIEEIQEVVDFYCARWMIEIFFRVLKSGCRIERRRFETLNRLSNCLAVYLIVAWRTLYVCRLGRSMPEINCEAIFEPEEWKAVYKIVERTEPPSEPPTLGDMIQRVAKLGGYIPRKDSPPGPQTIWIGLQRTHDFALAWKLFGPGSS